MTTLDLWPMASDLQAAFLAFCELLEQRGKDEQHKPAETFPVVRRGIEEVYHRIAFLVNSAAATGPKAEAEALIGELNGEIDRLNNEYHRALKNLDDGDHCVIEPVDTQPHTGRPITPVPVVHWREDGKPTVRLTLGTDFNLTYKHNTDVGMAELTLHGKGGYKGTKNIKFMIAR
jgi:hypothetical protein